MEVLDSVLVTIIDMEMLRYAGHVQWIEEDNERHWKKEWEEGLKNNRKMID